MKMEAGTQGQTTPKKKRIQLHKHAYKHAKRRKQTTEPESEQAG